MRPLAPHDKGSLACPSQTSPCCFVVLCLFYPLVVFLSSGIADAGRFDVSLQRSASVSRPNPAPLLDNCAE
jgi:hypothetical protein